MAGHGHTVPVPADRLQVLPLAAKGTERPAPPPRERTSAHGLKLLQGRFRLGIRQSLLPGRIIKRGAGLPGEGQELLPAEVL